MARTKKVVPKIPHNVKERFRHQNLQRLLENVASHVPQLPALKKETKAKKLRRIVLYMKFLLQKRTQLSEAATRVQEHVCISRVEENKEVVKERKEDSKVRSTEKSKSRQPQIVFLRKSAQTSRQNKISATVTSKEALCTEGYESEYNVTEMSSDARTSLANRENLDDSQHGNLTSYYCSPFNPKDPNCDSYPPCYFKTNIPTFENPSLSVFKRPCEEVIYDPTEMCNIRTAKKNAAETRLGRNSSNQTRDTFNPNPSAFPEYVFSESNVDHSFALNSGLNKKSNVYETEAREFVEKRAMLENDAKDKLPPLSTLKYPGAFYPNLYFGNVTLISNAPKNVGFLQDGDNFPLEVFSSGESAPITSSGEFFSSDETDFVEKMSQESTDFNNTMVIAGSEDSFDSCNEVKKFNCYNYKDPTEAFFNMEQYVNLSQANAPMSYYAHSTMNPDSNMSEISSDYVRCFANRNSATYNELQNGIQPRLVRHMDILNFQQNNPGYYHFYPVSRVCDNGTNSESILEKDNSCSPQESYYPNTGRCDNGRNSESIVQQDNSGSPQESYYVYPVSRIYDNGENSEGIVKEVHSDSPQGNYNVYPGRCDNGANSENIIEQGNSCSPKESYYAYPGRCDNGANSESIVQQDNSGSPQESYYVYPVSRIYDNGENLESIVKEVHSDSPQGSYNVYPGRCDNGANSESILEQDNIGSSQEMYYPEIQEEIVPDKNSPARLAETRCDVEFKRPKMKTRKEHNFFVPNNDCLSVDLQEGGDFFGSSKLRIADESVGCSSRKQESSAQFGHSSFKIGDECDSYNETIAKQEEPSLLAEEISYSLNNLDTW